MLTSFNMVCFLIGLLLTPTLLSNHEASTLASDPSSTILESLPTPFCGFTFSIHISVPFLAPQALLIVVRNVCLVVWANSLRGRQSAFEKDGRQGSAVALETGPLLPWLSPLESTMTGVGRLSLLLLNHFLIVTALLATHTVLLET